MASSKTSSPVQIRCKGILFDMDGTPISSIGSVERSWTRWALLRGVDPARAISIAHGCRTSPAVLPGTNPKVKLVEQGDRYILQFSPGPDLKQASTALVSTGTLGRAKTPGLSYENADGTSLKVDTDYFGKQRSKTKPTAGGSAPLSYSASYGSSSVLFTWHAFL